MATKPKDPRQPRITDVAKLAGVSTATVSRTIASPEQVRPKLREQVEQAIRQLEYTPHPVARSLRAGKTKMVLVMTRQRWSAPFFSEILHGIDIELLKHGYSMILSNLDQGPKERHAMDMAFSGHFDGAVMLSGKVPATRNHDILESGIPIVSICTALPGTYNVVTNEGKCIVDGVRHLVGLGHKAFIYLSGPADNRNDIDRWQAIRDFFAQTDDAALHVERIECDFSFDDGIRAARHFLKQEKRARPTAVIACSDELAIGFMKQIRAGGVRVPEEVSVVGFDGIDFANFCEPTLTTIRQPRLDMGMAGARALINIIEQRGPDAPNPLILPSELVVAHSTGPAPTAIS